MSIEDIYLLKIVSRFENMLYYMKTKEDAWAVNDWLNAQKLEYQRRFGRKISFREDILPVLFEIRGFPPKTYFMWN